MKLDKKLSVVKLILHMLTLLTCTCCFLYQTSKLLTMYWSGKTMAENRVERLVNSRLPAITICLPTFMDMEKFAELFLKSSHNQDHQTLYQDHQVLKKLVAEQGWNKEAQDSQKELFEKFLWNAYAVSNMSLYDTMHKYLADIQVEYKVYFGKTTYNKAFNEANQMVELPVPRKVVSLVPFRDARECLTLFSDFDDNFKDTKLTPIEVEVRFRHNVSSFPFDRYYAGEIYASLHSPNVLPDFRRENVFKEIKMGMVNFITYSETQTKLLREPYETKCKNYQDETRGECVHTCLHERLSRMFDIECLWSSYNYKLIRMDALGDLANKTLCNLKQDDRVWDIVKEHYHLERTCQSQCPRNCFESHYQYEIQTRKGVHYTEDHNCFSINIDHNSYYDQVIEHKPIMDWITLVSNWGGLLGMWLGLSVLYMSNKLIDKIFEKYILPKKKQWVPLTLPLYTKKFVRTNTMPFNIENNGKSYINNDIVF